MTGIGLNIEEVREGALGGSDSEIKDLEMGNLVQDSV